MTYRYLGEDVEQERQHGEVHADAITSESLLDVLGHREDTGSDVHRYEQPTQHQYDEDRLFIYVNKTKN